MEAVLRFSARRVASSARGDRFACFSRWISGTALVEYGEAEGAWKWAVRKQVWSLCDKRANAVPKTRFPMFSGANVAAYLLSRKLPVYRDSFCICVGTDSVLRHLRTMALKAKKSLLIPHLHINPFIKQNCAFTRLNPASIAPAQMEAATTKSRFFDLGDDVNVDEFVVVNFILIGSVAVDPHTGARIGKGDGMEDLEYALLRRMGVGESTMVVTIVDDKQLVNDMPVELLSNHDVPVDMICTPTQTIFTNTSLPKPSGIFWDKLTQERVDKSAVLRQIKNKVEKETGKIVKLAPPNAQPPPLRSKDDSKPAILISEINPTVTERELQQHLQKLGVREPVSLFKLKHKLVARVEIPKGSEMAACMSGIDGSELKGWRLRAKEDA